MARKRDDSVKPGCGIDGTEGENFTKRGSDPWNPPKTSDGISKPGGKYTNNDDAGLRQKRFTAPNFDDSTYSIDADVTANQSDSGNRAIKSRG